MPVNFVVEDGTSKTDSTAYCDLDFVDNYSKRFSGVFSDLDEDIKKTAINKATRDIDILFDFFGRRTRREQSLQFPRSNCLDLEFDDYYDENVIPEKLKKAVAELAVNIAVDGLETIQNSDTNYKVEKIDVLTFERFTNEAPKVKLPIVEKYLEDISEKKQTNCIDLERA